MQLGNDTENGSKVHTLEVLAVVEDIDKVALEML